MNALVQLPPKLSRLGPSERRSEFVDKRLLELAEEELGYDPQQKKWVFLDEIVRHGIRAMLAQKYSSAGVEQAKDAA